MPGVISKGLTLFFSSFSFSSGIRQHASENNEGRTRFNRGNVMNDKSHYSRIAY